MLGGYPLRMLFSVTREWVALWMLRCMVFAHDALIRLGDQLFYIELAEESTEAKSE